MQLKNWITRPIIKHPFFHSDAKHIRHQMHLTTKTSLETFSMEKLDLGKLTVFGAQTYIHVPKSKRQSRWTLCERNFGWNKQGEKKLQVLHTCIEESGYLYKDVFIDEKRNPCTIWM